jgi:hypothetical protein
LDQNCGVKQQSQHLNCFHFAFTRMPGCPSGFPLRAVLMNVAAGHRAALQVCSVDPEESRG